MTNATMVQDIAEMMKNWNKVESNVNEAYPNLDSESRYQMTSAAFRASLGI